ncbi:MAG: hypothetical protein AAF802_16375, partial [Planctomycetota bacterium]
MMNIRLKPSATRRSASYAVAIAMAAAMTCLHGGQAAGQSRLTSGPQSFLAPGTRIVPASSVETEADLASPRGISNATFAPGQLSQAVNQSAISPVGYCSSCSTPSYGTGGCNTCGPQGGSNVCGIPCDPYQYVKVEGLFLQRQGDDGFSLSRNRSLDEFQFEWAPRITLGALPNCVNGYEFTWVGPFEFDRRLTVADTAGGLDSILFDGDNPVVLPANDFDGTFLDPFNNAILHDQFYNSEYWSAEVNKTIVGWDVVRLLFGAKFIRIEEEYGFNSQTAITTASLNSQTENSYLGVQAGLDLLYPIAKHAYSDFRVRGGVYLNFVDTEVRLQNSGVTILNPRRSDEQVAGVFEFYYGLRYDLGEMLSLKAGGEIWYIT